MCMLTHDAQRESGREVGARQCTRLNLPSATSDDNCISRDMQQPKSLIISGIIQNHRKTVPKPSGLDARPGTAFDPVLSFLAVPATEQLRREAGYQVPCDQAVAMACWHTAS